MMTPVDNVEAVHILDGADELREHCFGFVFGKSASQPHIFQQVAMTCHLHHHHYLKHASVHCERKPSRRNNKTTSGSFRLGPGAQSSPVLASPSPFRDGISTPDCLPGLCPCIPLGDFCTENSYLPPLEKFAVPIQLSPHPL